MNRFIVCNILETELIVNKMGGPSGSPHAKGVKIGSLNVEKEAIEQLEWIHPDYTSSHNKIGITYGKPGTYQHAIHAFKRALEIDPKMPIDAFVKSNP
jgi:tetratricopeptide (TPR) repeat protein